MDTNNLLDHHKSLKSSINSRTPNNSQASEFKEDALFQRLNEAESLIEVFLGSDMTNYEPITIHSYFCVLSSLIDQARKISENLIFEP